MEVGKFLEIPIKKLAKAKWNYKTDNDEMKQSLLENIKKNGQLENLIVRELKDKYEVVNGNHRLDVFIELKAKKVMCCNVGKITPKQAYRVALETNETKFDSDDVKMANLVKEILTEVEIDDLSTTMPWKAEELENMKKLSNFDWSQYDKDGEKKEKGTDPFTKLVFDLPEPVAMQLAEQIDRFKKALHPEQEVLATVSYVQPIEAICQHLAQIPDKELI